MRKLPRGLRRVCLDFIGYSLILLAGLVGWLPGPGGIPLAMAGLAILSLNNSWAKKIRFYLQKEGDKLLDKLFPDEEQICRLWDRVNLVALVAAVLVPLWQQNIFGLAGASILLAVNLVIFWRNRQRFEELVKRLKKRGKR